MPNELYNACHDGLFESVQNLVEANPSLVNQLSTGNDLYPIYIAARKGHLEIVQFLLDKSAKTSDPQSLGFNLLYWACRCDDFEKRQKILEYIYLNFNKCKFTDGTTQLHVAAALGNFDQCAKQKTELSIPNTIGITPFYFALIMKQGKIFELMNCSTNNQEMSLADFFDDSKVENYSKYIFLIDWVSQINAKSYATIIEYSLLLIRKLEKIIEEKSHIDLNSVINDKRNLSECYRQFGEIFIRKEKYSLAVKAHTDSATVLENIIEKTDCDKERLDILYRNLSYLRFQYGERLIKEEKFSEAVIAFKDAVDACDKIKTKKKSYEDHFNKCCIYLANTYNLLGIALDKSAAYSEAIDAYKNALVAYDRITLKTDDNVRHLDIYYRNLLHCYTNFGIRLGTIDKKYDEAANAFKDSITIGDKIHSKEDDDHLRICKNYMNIAIMYISMNVLPETVNVVECYQKAVQEIFNIKNYTDMIYHRITRVYVDWCQCYPRMSYGWNMADLGILLFTMDVGVDFNKKFFPIYHMVKNNPYIPEMLKLLPMLIQLMELLLKCSEHHDNKSLQPLGVRYILQSDENKNSFKAKLNELRAILQSLSSLKNLLDHNPSVQMAFLNKIIDIESALNTVKAENKSLQRENKELRDRLELLESTTAKTYLRPVENKSVLSTDVTMKDTTSLQFFSAAVSTSDHPQLPQLIHLARRNSSTQNDSNSKGAKRLIDDEGDQILSKVRAVELPEEASPLPDGKQSEHSYEKQMR